MSTIVPITIEASPLPSNFQGTPQQFMDAMVDRLSVTTAVDSVSIVTQGSTAPTSDVGPWLKNGTTWYVWSVASASYVPLNAEFQTLKYVASQTAPDQNKYTLWVQLNTAPIVNGAVTSPPGTQAIGLAYWNAPAVTWRNIYDSTFEVYNEQIDTAATLYPFRGDKTVSENLVFAGPGPETKTATLALTETFDPSGVFASSLFTAPVGGYFNISAKLALEVSAGTPTDNVVVFGLKKGGVALPNDLYTFPIEDGVLAVRNYAVNSLIYLNFGEQVGLYADFTATGAGTWTIKPDGTSISGFRVNATK